MRLDVSIARPIRSDLEAPYKHSGYFCMPMTRVCVRTLVTSCLLLSSAASHGATPADTEALKLWAERIGTAYEQLASNASQLNESATNYCKSSSEAEIDEVGIENVRGNWKEAFLAWQKIRFVDFGPIVQNSRAWQLQFWPDPKNLTQQKVDEWLNAPSEIQSRPMASEGVALQGFPAMEYLLYGEPGNEADDNLDSRATRTLSADQCKLLSQIANHVDSVTKALAADWQTFKPTYAEQSSYTDKTAISMLDAVAFLLNRRLASVMGLAGSGSPDATRGDAWRSGVSLDAQQATLVGIKQNFLPGMDILLKQRGQSELGEEIEKTLDQTIASYETAKGALNTQLKSDEGYARLQRVYIKLSLLSQKLESDLSRALRLLRGFNSSDGD